MAAVVNTNVMSLNAQRQLGKSQATSQQAMERLSSGLRINSAKDDAAGLAISTGMQSQIKGINRAVQNANDGVSMAQTAEGAMDEMTTILQRMRELSVQSANATNSSKNRDSIQTEVDQLYSELGRISETTQFNGAKLLDGSSDGVTLQIGANKGETMDVNIKDVRAHALGIDGGVTKGDLNGDRVKGSVIAKDTIEINDIKIGAVDDPNKLGAAGIAESINKKTPETNVTASAYNSVEGAKGDTVTGNTHGLEITVGNGDKVTLGTTNNMENLRDTINKDVSGVNATISSEGQLQLTNDTGEKITIGVSAGGDISKSGLEAGTFEGYVALSSTNGDPIKVSGATNDFGLMETNGAGSITAAGTDSAAKSSLSEDDAISINGAKLEVHGDVLMSATGVEPKVYSGATLDNKVDAINSLSDKTGVTAALVETKPASANFKAESLSSTKFVIADADVAAISAGGASSVITFDGKDVNIAGASTNEEMAAIFQADETLGGKYTFTGTATSFNIEEKVPTGAVLGNITVAGADTTAEVDKVTAAGGDAAAITAAGLVDAAAIVAADAGTAKIGGAAPAGVVRITGALQVGDAAEKAIVLTSNDNKEISITSNAEAGNTKTATENQDAALAKLGVISTGGAKADDLGIDVTTAAHAGRSIEMIDKALEKISGSRADLGAVQNRLGSTVSNLENVSQNLAASNSRIQDADFAKETSKMSKAQILQQAGTSMLAQANASSQSVLSLLG